LKCHKFLAGLGLLVVFVTTLPLAAFGLDSDGDTVDDATDNCIDTPNLSQTDTDCDTFGNACDADFNNDGFVNGLDGALFLSAVPSDPLFDLTEPPNGMKDAADQAVFAALFNFPPGPSAGVLVPLVCRTSTGPLPIPPDVVSEVGYPGAGYGYFPNAKTRPLTTSETVVVPWGLHVEDEVKNVAGIIFRVHYDSNELDLIHTNAGTLNFINTLVNSTPFGQPPPASIFPFGTLTSNSVIPFSSTFPPLPSSSPGFSSNFRTHVGWVGSTFATTTMSALNSGTTLFSSATYTFASFSIHARHTSLTNSDVDFSVPTFWLIRHATTFQTDFTFSPWSVWRHPPTTSPAHFSPTMFLSPSDLYLPRTTLSGTSAVPRPQIAAHLGLEHVTPTATPTATPTVSPTVSPTVTPTVSPTVSPTVTPTATPTATPTPMPTATPTSTPTATPTSTPTVSPTPPPATVCTLPPSDMTAWWPLDETSGLVAADLIGSSPGTYVGSVTHPEGKVDRSVHIGDTTQYVNATSNAALNFGMGSFSIDAWVRTDDTGTGVRIIVDKREGSPFKGYLLAIFQGRLFFQLANGTGSPDFSNYQSTVSGVLNDTSWHHVAVTVDRDHSPPEEGGRLYIDGIVVHTFNPTDRPNVDNSSDLKIGRNAPSSASSIVGNIDEVELFSRALSSTEVFGIYNAGIYGKCKPTSDLVDHYKVYTVDGANTSFAPLLEDQFGAGTVNLTNLGKLGVPVSKAIAPDSPSGVLLRPAEHLLWYEFFEAQPPRFARLKNQFTTENKGALWAVGNGRFLLVPAIKDLEGTIELGQHWKCYDAIDYFDPNVTVNLLDQLHEETNVVVGPGRYVCNPVQKTRPPSLPEPPPPLPDEHLVCYDIPFDPSPSDCCISNGSAGCDTPTCEVDVCAVDSDCCTSGWDSTCASKAASLCGGLCPFDSSHVADDQFGSWVTNVVNPELLCLPSVQFLPEPSVLISFGPGLMLLGWLDRRRRRRAIGR